MLPANHEENMREENNMLCQVVRRNGEMVEVIWQVEGGLDGEASPGDDAAVVAVI
jgi:hypothetical protein